MSNPGTVSFWAIIVVGSRSEWIHTATIARTRAEAWKKYSDHWIPSAYQLHRRRARQPGGVYARRVDIVPQ